MSEGEAALASEEEEEEEQDEEGGAAGEQLPDKLQPSELDLARLRCFWTSAWHTHVHASLCCLPTSRTCL